MARCLLSVTPREHKSQLQAHVPSRAHGTIHREPMKKRFVLVVETDPVARRHLTSLLETWGYEPVVAGSVDESLAVLAHSHFLFSLLNLDLDGADGNELLKRLEVQVEQAEKEVA